MHPHRPLSTRVCTPHSWPTCHRGNGQHLLSGLRSPGHPAERVR
jgi:hypothetical protein